MLKAAKLTVHVGKTFRFLRKFPNFPAGFSRNFSYSSLRDDDGSENETEWERLLKPFDLKELRRSFNQITPFQLCKLLILPLDVSTSMAIFQRAGSQKGYCHTFDVYHVLIDKLGAAKEFKAIDKLLLQMQEEGIVFRESLFLCIMKHYGRASFPGQATRLLLDMKGVYDCEPTFRSYNVVLDILVSGNCPSVASNVFYDMLSKGVIPTVYTFGVVMKALCMVNEVDNACSLLKDMMQYGCTPNAIVYQTLIHALSKRDRLNEALKLLDEMFLWGCMPDVDTFNDVIHGLCRLNRIHEGAKLVDRMLIRGFTPNDMTYGVLMNGLCRVGQVDEAKMGFARRDLWVQLLNWSTTCLSMIASPM
ncbi:pentatricopeptide repeat-containing protein At5g64320, mitochondrial [Mercurialis annua]|uniref:pentatricopeptide repeat-containing protein At5g64320, mitochondrial n=1 Tax=Mercurialis annua TaxID=3986 RepID=UPI0024AD0F7D|nr:pentatricopeptide repeat-containing protein At5g64320, mitochondrial [Mercurialis annua]